VFAIAITLLIIEIALPASISHADLPRVLLDLWPRYLAYVLSFLAIARFWAIHRQAFQLIIRCDTTLIWLTLLLLMFVAFLPFPTAVLGDHGGAPAAAVLSAVAVSVASAASLAYWWYASGSGGLLRQDAQPEQVKLLRARGLSGPVLFTLTVPVAAFAPYAAEVLWICGYPSRGSPSSGSLAASPHGRTEPINSRAGRRW
jgi:uncharacterized membrane protein